MATDSYEAPTDGSAPPKVVLKRELRAAPSDWSANGLLLFSSVSEGHPIPSLSVYSPEDDKIRVFAVRGLEGQFSPDGKWVAYMSPGGIFVQAFPGPGAKVQVSTDAGSQPRWSRDGKQVVYIQPDKKLMAVKFDSRTASASAPRVLFQTRISETLAGGLQYDVAPDGRFLINSLPADRSAPLTLLTNWNAKLNNK